MGWINKFALLLLISILLIGAEPGGAAARTDASRFAPGEVQSLGVARVGCLAGYRKIQTRRKAKVSPVQNCDPLLIRVRGMRPRDAT